METILVFNGNQPCLHIEKYTKISKDSPNYNKSFGLNRNRNPDNNWGQLTSTCTSYAKKVELTSELKQILIEDLAYAYGNSSELFTAKLKEFNLFLM